MKNLTSLGLRFQDQKLSILDQTLLPHQEVWIDVRDCDHMVELIQCLAVRGAPLIGVAAALAIGQSALRKDGLDDIVAKAKKLREARPTAVNLMAAMDRLVLSQNPRELTHASLVSGAEAIFEEDVRMCEALAERGSAFIDDGDGILTHCNTGGLVTAGIGTALGVVRRAQEQGKKIHVYVDETRPLLQGARLTTWELEQLGIPHTLICDNMAGFLMAQGKIQKVFTGADRIARNGDTANKIGTYGVAVLANYHKIPFYIVAPTTTFDANCPSGKEIPVELRNPDEVRAGKSPRDTRVWNPAFDVTPRSLITKIILDDRVL
ncbi:MAG: S-methyl-5-thioribose-1-phosphate isomerase [Bdellovibrionota bacterium]